MIEAARWKVMQLAFVREFHFEGNFDYLMYVKLVLVCFPPPPPARASLLLLRLVFKFTQQMITQC